ncbi:hypothetical protein BU23DRAFT_599585 [Bimuria novae-zelandiae CBS 107.79]|uniref:Uncharacterized protein n=1 Tax=Bimuria novae-zelandiae CBS 107.79 TaxID=1447943 RepID=A0A6A5V5K2_9PLEO|nr:hypothetical protein BU23DRAFT_599585 [Bimuria novae-zelandiae CBS 107.79]
MAPGQPYHGPINMSESRFAAPHTRRQAKSLSASNPDIKSQKDAERTIATREQIDAAAAKAAERAQSDGLELAQAQTMAIQEEVAQHTSEVERTISKMNSTIRQNLVLIREAIEKECPETAAASLQIVDTLWNDLEKLFAAARDAKEATPRFLKKQKQNIGLIVATKVLEVHEDVQQEMNCKDKKFNLMQEQVLGWQQAIHNVKANFDNKNADLQERLGRVQLEHGLLKDELDNAKNQLATALTAEKHATKVAEELQKQMESLNQSKAGIVTDNDNLRTTIKNLETKLKAVEEKATEYYEKEMRSMTEKLQKEQQKATALDTDLKVLRQTEEATRKESEKVKSEYKLLSEKYKNQGGVYAKVTEVHIYPTCASSNHTAEIAIQDLKVQAKKVATLEGDMRKLQEKVVELEKEHDRVTFLKNSLQKQHDALKTELDEMKKKEALARDETQQLSEKLERTKKENDELETENNDLRAKQFQHNNVIAALKIIDAENAMLRDTTQNLKKTPSSPNEPTDVAALKSEVEELKEKLTESEKNRADWEDFGKKAHENAVAAQNKARELKGAGKQLAQARAQNEALQTQIEVLRAAGGSHQDVKYWRDKYNELLGEMEG